MATTPTPHIGAQVGEIAEKVIMAGDPLRAKFMAERYLENPVQYNNVRGMLGYTGTYKGKRITVLSTGIGCDNIDIVVNELDALANIDFETRTQKSEFCQLEMVRIGTCGGLQPHTPVGTYISSCKSIGFDGLLNYYAGRNEVCDLEFEKAFTYHMQWNPQKGAPYVIDNDIDLITRINCGDMVNGVTIAAGGFFGPQGRKLRIPLEDPEQNDKIMSFEHEGHLITNFEMEGSALAGLSRLLGHKAMTVCMVIANRRAHEANTNYKNSIDDLIVKVLERI